MVDTTVDLTESSNPISVQTLKYEMLINAGYPMKKFMQNIQIVFASIVFYKS